MKRKLLFVISFILILIVTGCNSSNKTYDEMYPSEITGFSYKLLEDVGEFKIFELSDYNNILLREYDVIAQDGYSKTWTINYNKRFKYLEYDLFDEAALETLYSYVNENLTYFEDKLDLELSIYCYEEEYNLEETIENDRLEKMSIHIIDLYIPFIVETDSRGAFISIPVKTYYLRGYENEIEDLNNNFIPYNEFYEKYNMHY